MRKTEPFRESEEVIYIGIDPGQGGGIAWISFGRKIEAAKFTEQNIIRELFAIITTVGTPSRIVLEHVHAMPKQGVSSTFKFGANYGWWRGFLTAIGREWQDVEPRVWQKHLGCLTKGDKNVTKNFAARLVNESGSKLRVTHAVADAICLAEYARRTAAGS
jgi:crossover junction endodeoxyribonuclease RuvC